MHKIFYCCFLGFAFLSCLSPPPLKPTPHFTTHKKTPPSIPSKVKGPEKIDSSQPALEKRENVSFQIRGDRKKISLHPVFSWTFPKSWKIHKVLLNLYQTGEFEKGGAPEIIVFDLGKQGEVQLGPKSRRLNYYGKNESLKLMPHANYTALLIVEALPKGAVKKIRFITEKK